MMLFKRKSIFILLLRVSIPVAQAEVPVFRADVLDVPGLNNGLSGVVYLYGVGAVTANDLDATSGPTAYNGHIEGLDCAGKNGCSITVSPYLQCMHIMSRAPEFFSSIWKNEQFGSGEDFSGVVAGEDFSELDGKTIVSKYKH